MFLKTVRLSHKFAYALICLCLACTEVCAFASGQEPIEPADLFEMSLEQLMEVEVVSAASRYEQKITEAPASVTVITADEIRLYGYRTLADILQSVRSFHVFNDRNYTYINVRGVGPATDYYNRVLVLVDGHRISENISGSTYFGNDFLLDVDLIERIEIVRGPVSSLYGADAMFGVVNILTKNGKNYKGTEVSGKIATYQTQKERLTYGNIFDNGLDILVSASSFGSNGHELYYSEFDDPATNYGNVDNDGEKARNLFAKITFGDWSLITANVVREKKIPTASFLQVFNDHRSKTLDKMTLVGLTYHHPFSDTFSVTNKATYHHFDYDGRYVYADGDTYVNNDMWRGRWWRDELMFTAKPFERHRITWGGDFCYNQKEFRKNWDSEVYTNDNRHLWNWGAYVEDEYHILDNLLLNTGVRYDEYQTIGNTTNPRVGLVYNYSNDTTLKLLYGQAFRPPTTAEKYYDVPSKNEGLKPETITTYEVVLEHNLDKTTKITATGFYYKLEDFIIKQQVPFAVYINTDGITGTGGEFEIEKIWQNGITGKASYSYVRAELMDTHKIMANSPQHLVKINLITPLIKDKLFAGIETQYTGKTKTTQGGTVNGFGVTNLTLTYQNLIKNLDVAVGIFNLFDEKYSYSAGSDHVQDHIEQDGRTVGLKLTYRF